MLLQPEFIVYLWLFPVTLFFVLPLLFASAKWFCQIVFQKKERLPEKENCRQELTGEKITALSY